VMRGRQRVVEIALKRGWTRGSGAAERKGQMHHFAVLCGVRGPMYNKAYVCIILRPSQKQTGRMKMPASGTPETRWNRVRQPH